MKDKEARRAYQQKWREANAEWVKEQSRQWNLRNKDKKEAKRLAIPKDIRRAKIIFRLYKLTKDTYECMLVAQGNSCAICNKQFIEPDLTPQVDHDHSCCPAEKTCGNCVRGLLCYRCNSGLGFPSG